MSRASRCRNNNNSLELGCLVYVRYLDHVLLKNMDPKKHYPPLVAECVGWLVENGDSYIRVEFERFGRIENGINLTKKMSCITIIKNCILELRILKEEM